jgi:uncharacterized Zn-binding protein involved in type VI secretion
MHTCPMVDPGPKPHVGGPILPPCEPTVLIGGMPAARVTDKCTCVGPPDVIAKGSPSVLIGNLMAARLGDLTVHGGVITVGCPTVIIGEVGMGFGPGPITPEAAAALFALLAAQGDIAFGFPVDGCYSRAHLMVQRMQQMGLTPGKVWSFANPDALRANTPNHPDGYVEWGYHVAPTVPVVQPDGSVQDMVMDPSMFDRPVSVDEWRDAQRAPGRSEPYIDQTAPGDAPTFPDGTSPGGSGYWPAPDPVEGPDEHARETMEEYKRYEGTRGP